MRSGYADIDQSRPSRRLAIVLITLLVPGVIAVAVITHRSRQPATDVTPIDGVQPPAADREPTALFDSDAPVGT